MGRALITGRIHTKISQPCVTLLSRCRAVPIDCVMQLEGFRLNEESSHAGQ